jgi:hypothetical protein
VFEPHQQLTLKREALPLSIIGIDHLFERIEILPGMAISHQVDIAKSSFAQ